MKSYRLVAVVAKNPSCMNNMARGVAILLITAATRHRNAVAAHNDISKGCVNANNDTDRSELICTNMEGESLPRFRHDERVETLLLHGNYWDRVQAFAFANFPTLRDLTLFGSKVVYIAAQALDGIPELEHLNMSENRIASLPDGVFYSLSKLQDILLAYNQIKHISNKTFSGAEEVTFIHLGGNHISNIAPFAFKDQKKLHLLALWYNRITVLLNRTIPLIKGIQVSLTSNGMTFILSGAFYVPEERADLMERADKKVVNLSDNAISKIPQGAFPEQGVYFHYIGLRRNKIQCDKEFVVPHTNILVLEMDDYVSMCTQFVRYFTPNTRRVVTYTDPEDEITTATPATTAHNPLDDVVFHAENVIVVVGILGVIVSVVIFGVLRHLKKKKEREQGSASPHQAAAAAGPPRKSGKKRSHKRRSRRGRSTTTARKPQRHDPSQSVQGGSASRVPSSGESTELHGQENPSFAPARQSRHSAQPGKATRNTR